MCLQCLLTHFEQASVCPGPCHGEIRGWTAQGVFTAIQQRHRHPSQIDAAVHVDFEVEYADDPERERQEEEARARRARALRAREDVLVAWADDPEMEDAAAELVVLRARWAAEAAAREREDREHGGGGA